MVVKNKKVYQKMKNKNLLIIKKKKEKLPYYNYNDEESLLRL